MADFNLHYSACNDFPDLDATQPIGSVGSLRSFDERQSAGEQRDPRANATVGSCDDEEEVFRILVPDGTQPGEKLVTNSPDGQRLRLTVPKGVLPGDLLVLHRGMGTWRCTAEIAAEMPREASQQRQLAHDPPAQQQPLPTLPAPPPPPQPPQQQWQQQPTANPANRATIHLPGPNQPPPTRPLPPAGQWASAVDVTLWAKNQAPSRSSSVSTTTSGSISLPLPSSEMAALRAAAAQVVPLAQQQQHEACMLRRLPPVHISNLGSAAGSAVSTPRGSYVPSPSGSFEPTPATHFFMQHIPQSQPAPHRGAAVSQAGRGTLGLACQAPRRPRTEQRQHHQWQRPQRDATHPPGGNLIVPGGLPGSQTPPQMFAPPMLLGGLSRSSSASSLQEAVPGVAATPPAPSVGLQGGCFQHQQPPPLSRSSSNSLLQQMPPPQPGLMQMPSLSRSSSSSSLQQMPNWLVGYEKAQEQQHLKQQQRAKTAAAHQAKKPQNAQGGAAMALTRRRQRKSCC